jgi:uncharacterized OB-fold protein
MPKPYEPVPTTDTKPYWDAAKEGRLRIQHCSACDQHYFYPRPFCPNCGSGDVVWVDTSGIGSLHSYVINGRPLPGTEGFSPVIALVKLSEGPVLLTHIVGVEPKPENLPLDMAVQVDFEPRGDAMVPVFRPLESE